MNAKYRPILIAAALLLMCVLGIGFGYWWGGGSGPAEPVEPSDAPTTSVTDRLRSPPGPLPERSASADGLLGAGPVTPAGADDPEGVDGAVDDEGGGVTSGRPTVFAIDAQGLAASIDSTMPELTECYASLLEAVPDAAGSMSIELSIGPEEGSATSRVLEVDLLDEGLEDDAMQECVAGVLHELHYEPGSRVIMTWPFSFRPE